MKVLAMPLKNIAVFVDVSRASLIRATYAVRLALRYHAHLVGIFVVPLGWTLDPSASFIRGRDAIRALIERQRAQEFRTTATASERFENEAGREGISFEFRMIRATDTSDDALFHSLHADLVLVGHPKPGGLPDDWSAETMLLATGVPVLIVPNGWTAGTIAENVVVAWNASREARRAITDAIPLLQKARTVSIIVVDAEANTNHGQEPGADIALYLSRHGINVMVEQVRSDGRSIAGTIMDRALLLGADLLVLGAYSHSRSREVLFGGVTRSLLKSAAIPLFIAH
nr:universal stress protein [Bradyrhizobium campsiandrae]